ncbi:hypothetical protein CGC58_04845 [Capnocytophaga stomatis]|uniref:Glycosyl transferase family 1 domain-containing protein n=1 Tax=Capnocytophaga stomatis TaxID=1848904 RepID=A0A250FVB8_9FLAO|nr:glycosyltransferase family 4 protein [Capnocytophaga stomatis]ATA89102.1 hypothetical protein CGC58_04845 [Capnocytophaga stomatis]
MKIIFLEAVQNFGGARKSTIELAKRIQSLGHQVLIVDFWGCNQPFVQETKSCLLELKVLDPREKPLIISSKSKLKYLCNAVKYFFLERKYKKEFSKIVEEFRPDVVNVNNTKCLNILASNSFYKIEFFARGWFDYKGLSLFTKRILKKYKPQFLTVSQATRQAIFTGGLTNLENIRVFVDVIDSNIFNQYTPSYEKPFNDENPIKLLHSGGFLKTKGQHICIGVARKLKEMNIPFKMCLTGIIYKGEESEKYYHYISNLISKYELQDEVKIVLDPPNIMDYFRETDVLIHPSWTEGLPRVCLEAMAFGKPIIGNAVGGVTDVVIHNFTGFITDFNDLDQYTEYVVKYLKNYDLYKSHSSMSRQLIKQNYLDSDQIQNIKRIYPI